jgi:hypothetical protein
LLLQVGNACVTAVLKPEGGASGVGRSVVKYARQSNAAVVIVGSRGYGAFKRCVVVASLFTFPQKAGHIPPKTLHNQITQAIFFEA